METPDRELLTRIAGGDRAAFVEFYDRHAPRVLGLLVKWVRRRADAEDLLQEVFWQVWSRAGQYDATRSPPEVWLLLIARSRALDHLRIRRPVAEVEEYEPATCEAPSEGFERVEAEGCLRDALQRLPQDQSEAIRLAFLAGLTHSEIAGRLKVPLGTVKTRIRLGMNRLRDILQEH